MSASVLAAKTAVITGAGGGIGRALALRLAAAGVRLCCVGRRFANLESLAREASPPGSDLHLFACDLAIDDDLLALRARVERVFDRLDILVHCAGVIRTAPLESVPPAELDAQYRVNARAPLLLTQSLLPLVRAARGQIVFVNSSVGVRAKEHTGAYAASKHALKAIADTLRMEINPYGIRVISVFPGNTATEMQRQVCRELGRAYDPSALLQPDDVAAAVADALSLAPSAEVTDIHIRPALKSS